MPSYVSTASLKQKPRPQHSGGDPLGRSLAVFLTLLHRKKAITNSTRGPAEKILGLAVAGLAVSLAIRDLTD